MIAAIIIGVLVVIGGGVTAAILLLGGDDEESSSDDPESTQTAEPPEETSGSPEETAQQFIDAAMNQDCEAAEALVTEEFLTENGGCEGTEELSDLSGVEFGKPTVTDESEDTATVDVPLSFEGTEASFTLEMVNEDGAWLIDGVGTGEVEMPTDFTVPTG